MRALCVTLIFGSLALSAAAAAVDGPPPPIRWTGDHWTAWNPPPTPSDTTGFHVVQKGDTLWDLAGRNLGNPYLWPQIWEKNAWILDAHWIYPGDPLTLGISVEPLAPGETLTDATLSGADLAEGSTAEEGTLEIGGGAGVPSAYSADSNAGAAPAAPSDADSLIDLGVSSLGTPQALGFDADLACSGFVGEADARAIAKIVGSEHEAYVPALSGKAATSSVTGRWGKASVIKYGLEFGDIVYLDGGESVGLTPGTLYAAIAPSEKVRHPVSGQVVGRLVRSLGLVRVLSAQASSAIGEIVQVCDVIPVGTLLQAYEAEPIPLGRRTTPRPVNDPSSAESLESAPVILLAKDGIVSLGEDHVVFLDQGSAQELTPGDVFTVYRMNRTGMPPVPVGEIAVLSVREQSAVGRIIQSRLPIYVGDRLEKK